MDIQCILNPMPSMAREEEKINSYFKGELIPGFNVRKLTNSEDPSSIANLIKQLDLNYSAFLLSQSISHKSKTLSLVERIKTLPAEIRRHIYRCTTSLTVEFSTTCNPPRQPSAYLMLNYAPLPVSARVVNLHPNPARIADSTIAIPNKTYAPIKYALRLPPPRLSSTHPIQINLLRKIQLLREEPSDLKKLDAERKKQSIYCYKANNVNNLVSMAGELMKGIRGNLRMLENDYHGVGEYKGIISFVEGLIATEGWNYCEETDVWVLKDGNEDESLLKEFLDWFWENFVLDFTSALESSTNWISANYHQPVFRHLRNLNIDVVASIYRLNTRLIDSAPENTDLPHFTKFIQELRKHHSGNIQNLNVYLWIRISDVPDVLANPEKYNWVREIRQMVVGRSFKVYLKIFDLPVRGAPASPLRPQKGEQDEIKLHAVYQQKLREIMMPYSLLGETTNDDLGSRLSVSDDQEIRL